MQRLSVAKVVVECNDKALILRRSPDDAHRPNGLDMPGGSVWPDELPEAGASRELLEEAGIEVGHEDLTWYQSIDHDRPLGSNGELVRVTYHLFHAEVFSHAVILGDEHVSSRWVESRSMASVLDHPRWSPMIDYMLFVMQDDQESGRSVAS